MTVIIQKLGYRSHENRCNLRTQEEFLPFTHLTFSIDLFGNIVLPFDKIETWKSTKDILSIIWNSSLYARKLYVTLQVYLIFYPLWTRILETFEKSPSVKEINKLYIQVLNIENRMKPYTNC